VVDAGVGSFMASFSDLNGVPASGNQFLMSQVLRDEWQYEGFVVSDWDSIRQLSIHGLTSNHRESAYEAVTAGLDMEMAGDAYINHLVDLVREGEVAEGAIDTAVSNILRIKFAMGLFENPYVNPSQFPEVASADALDVARQAALESIVLLKNQDATLPLGADSLSSVAVIGPLADAPHEQLGTWIFDGDKSLSVTGLAGIQEFLGSNTEVNYVRAMETSRSRETEPFAEALEAAQSSDAVVLFLGEESILSGDRSNYGGSSTDAHEYRG
jgi:beta-glucosidase